MDSRCRMLARLFTRDKQHKGKKKGTGYYSTFHLANQRSLKVRPIVTRNVLSVIKFFADWLTHWKLTFNVERLFHAFTKGMPSPALTVISLGPSCPFIL